MGFLSIRDMTVRFGGIVAVDSLDMEVYKGSITSLIGPNGAGKTTVFNALTRVASIAKGCIEFEGTALTTKKPNQIIDLGIARTFQNLEIFRFMTVEENLLVGYHRNYRLSFFDDLLHLPRQSSQENEGKRRAKEVSEWIGLKNRLASYAGSLPFGHQKKLEIGRALMASPALLMLDEPAAGLNNYETKELKVLIRQMVHELGITIFLVEHDMSLVMDISDQITVMNFGKKIAEGSIEQVAKDPQVIAAYLGDRKYA